MSPQGFFHDMVGLGEHTPFECIGQVEESRLALALCRLAPLLPTPPDPERRLDAGAGAVTPA